MAWASHGLEQCLPPSLRHRWAFAGPCSLAPAREYGVPGFEVWHTNRGPSYCSTRPLSYHRPVEGRNGRSVSKHANMQGVAIAILASVMPPEPKYDASVHEKLMPISGNDVLTILQILMAREGKLPA